MRLELVRRGDPEADTLPGDNDATDLRLSLRDGRNDTLQPTEIQHRQRPHQVQNRYHRPRPPPSTGRQAP